RDWASRLTRERPDFFRRLARQQSPKYLWIGCSDSRVPANEIMGLMPGEVFVHRNVANVVAHGDLNCLSTIQFAVDVLRVKHILVVGHYGCGGVQAVLDQSRLGLVDNWLRHVGDVLIKHRAMLDEVDLDSLRHARLCELNVIEQAANACLTTVVQDAWARGQKLAVHAWIYSLFDGQIRPLGMRVEQPQALLDAQAGALARLTRPLDFAR
uniref:carbonate dehydratase n=1 Tax=Metallibacterium sp. TaxID=2940281 RepID=UPI002608F5C5